MPWFLLFCVGSVWLSLGEWSEMSVVRFWTSKQFVLRTRITKTLILSEREVNGKKICFYTIKSISYRDSYGLDRPFTSRSDNTSFSRPMWIQYKNSIPIVAMVSWYRRWKSKDTSHGSMCPHWIFFIIFIKLSHIIKIYLAIFPLCFLYKRILIEL